MGRRCGCGRGNGEERLDIGYWGFSRGGRGGSRWRLGTARAVAGVGVFVVAAGIVEEGEEADDLPVGGMVAAEFHAVAQDGEPMGRAVVGGFGKAELGDDELPERNFVGEEEGEIVGWVGRRSHGADHFAYLAEAGGSRCRC